MAGSKAAAASYQPAAVTPPGIRRELRGAWIATVSNIDWPSTNNLTTAQQKAELVAMLDRAVELNLNTIIFQVRPACDALYASSLEPWSEYLTGSMGKAPQPFYDPLAFAVEEAHKRGLELHAWFNPYRARQATARSPICATHISRTKPQWVRAYGKSLWLDPGEKEVQDYSISVVIDVVHRYDVDGVHIDDYFYPYKEKDRAGRELDFPDEQSWRRFGAGRGMDRDDWRRENVNAFVRRLYAAVKDEKRWVKFGVSPFGIWRPANPPSVRGFDAFDKLYADSRKWLTTGWADYFAPQLYWAVDAPEQSFGELLKWWAAQNLHECLLAPGLDSTKAGRRWPPEEIVNQVRLTRKTPGVVGQVHWNMESLMRTRGLGSALQAEVYAEPALAPTPPRLKTAGPPKPACSARVAREELALSWGPGRGQSRPWRWLLQCKQGGAWKTALLPGKASSQTLKAPLPESIALTPIDRCGNLGPCAGLRLSGQP